MNGSVWNKLRVVSILKASGAARSPPCLILASGRNDMIEFGVMTLLVALQHVDASALLERELTTSKDLKTAKLDAIDRLLWGTKAKQRPSAAKEGQSMIQ